MHSLAFGEAMLAAARDYKTEMKAAEHARAEAAKVRTPRTRAAIRAVRMPNQYLTSIRAFSSQGHRVMDMQELADELADDPDLERIYEQRMAAIRQEQEERQKMQASGHGQVTEVNHSPRASAIHPQRHAMGVSGASSQGAQPDRSAAASPAGRGEGLFGRSDEDQARGGPLLPPGVRALQDHGQAPRDRRTQVLQNPLR